MINPFTILVVDDSPTQRIFLQDALANRGYTVDTARNGIEAIGRVYQSPPSLILSDVMMPELNGYHLCRLLKNDPYTAHIPVILLSNLREPHDRFWGEKAGADRYLEKGGDMGPILDEVDALIDSASPDKLCPIPSPFRELNSGDILCRITGILDRLLYESTISNEILKLTSLTHDPELLLREFLEFLSVVSHHGASALLFREGREKFILAIRTEGPVPESFIERAKEEVLQRAGLEGQNSQVRLVRLVGKTDCGASFGEDLHVLQDFPIVDGGDLLASVTLFAGNGVRLSEGSRHAMIVVTERFLIVLRYLRKLKEIEEVKADFVSMLVHDLRSPLTSIRGFTDVLAGGALGSVNDEQSTALGSIQGGCDRLLLLIDDILEYSKLEAGKMELHPIPLNLRPLAERITEDLSPLFREKGLELLIEIPGENPLVLADSKQLARVFTNLLTNAAKFTPHGGKVVLSSVDLSKGSGDEKPFIQVQVTDSGPGIPPDQQKKIFARYQQLPSGMMFRKGTGLGLTICKEIINLHRGEIWLESPVEENGGSRFSFTLPLVEG
ncbi:MAG: hybrid sensor histidine kinase/response regulator [Desulfuromonadales bacterium]